MVDVAGHEMGLLAGVTLALGHGKLIVPSLAIGAAQRKTPWLGCWLPIPPLARVDWREKAWYLTPQLVGMCGYLLGYSGLKIDS